MLRVLLASALAAASLASLAACSKDSAPAVSANAVVGKVLAVSGKVEAIRGGQARPLAVGGEIFGDDEVVTGADSSVQIHLAHNNARWALESGRRGKVQESASWTLAKVDTPPAPVEHATSAAGREGERNAATTTTTEVAAPAAAAEPAAPPPPPPPVPEAEPPAAKAESAPPKRRTSGASGDARSEERERADSNAMGSIGKGGGGAAPGGGASRGMRAPDDPADLETQAKIRTVIHAQVPTLKRCAGAAGVRIEVTVAQSTARARIVSGSPADPAALTACLDRALQQLKLQRASAFRVTLDL